jgi:myo-inositol 2-dehydrogenase/D-chiro-inositol 1-dehydrogenase
MSFKIAVVGCGNMAVGYHGPSYKRYATFRPDVELAACCDIDESKAESFKEKFGFTRHYTDIDLMLDEEKPDAVCLVVPVNLTASLSLKIMTKGYPLLLEKPPGMNRHETMEMIRLANERNVSNQVAFNRRYMPVVRKLIELLEIDREKHEYLNIQYRMLRTGRKDPDFSLTAIHGIDVVRLITASDYKTIDFRYQPCNQIEENVANFHLDCEFESGAVGRLDFFPVSGVNAERLEIHTYNHTFYVSLPVVNSLDASGKLLHIENNTIVQETIGTDLAGCTEAFVINGFYDENAKFFDDVRNGRKPSGGIESALQSVEVADCVRERTLKYAKFLQI